MGAPACDDAAMEISRPIETWLTDMDGVLVHEEDPIPGATESGTCSVGSTTS